MFAGAPGSTDRRMDASSRANGSRRPQQVVRENEPSPRSLDRRPAGRQDQEGRRRRARLRIETRAPRAAESTAGKPSAARMAGPAGSFATAAGRPQRWRSVSGGEETHLSPDRRARPPRRRELRRLRQGPPLREGRGRRGQPSGRGVRRGPLPRLSINRQAGVRRRRPSAGGSEKTLARRLGCARGKPPR